MRNLNSTQKVSPENSLPLPRYQKKSLVYNINDYV